MFAIPEAATAMLGVTTSAGVIAITFLARSLAATAGRAERAEAREKQVIDEVRHLVTARLPAYAQRLVSAHHPVPGLLSPQLAEAEAGKLVEAVLKQFAEATLMQRRRIDAAAWAAVRGTASNTQSVANRMQDLIDGLQRKSDNPELLDAFFKIDHLNEQMIRHLQKAAIAGGAWPGHVRDDTHVPDVVTGAQSRLPGWERIRVTSHLQATNVGVVGRAAEPIAVATAELMANALEHSSDDLRVEVTLLQTGSGTVSVVIDDAGTGMTSEECARGTRLVSGGGSLDLLLTELGDPPAFGFVAIGRLVADYGFQVSVDQRSVYNGVRAVLSIPPHLLVEIDEIAKPVSAMAPLPTAPPLPHHTVPQPAHTQDTGVPQRRRKSPRWEPDAPPAARTQALDPDRARTMWSDFQAGLIAARLNDPDTEGTT